MHVSPGAHSMAQSPPRQSSITRVECSARVPMGPMVQPPAVHSPIRQVRPRSQPIVQPISHWSRSQRGPSHSRLHPPTQLGRWQLAPSVQYMRQPPGHESITHSAPTPAQRVVQPPVAHFVAQSEPDVHVDWQPPVVQSVLQVAASHASSQPPKQFRLQEESLQTPRHKPAGQSKSQLALPWQSKEQGVLELPLQARLQDSPALHLQASPEHDSASMLPPPALPGAAPAEPAPAALATPPACEDSPESPAPSPSPPAPLSAALSVPPSAVVSPPSPAAPADAGAGGTGDESPQPNSNARASRALPPNPM